MPEVKLTEYLAHALVEEGVEYVFMIPGGYVDNIAKALVDTPDIKPIVCASEAGAAMMADGYARASQSLGVCLAISGPGASNMLTALGMSAADRIPVLAITGDNPLIWRDRDSIQDASHSGMATNDLLSRVVDVQYQLLEPRIVGDYLRRSFLHMSASDPGPVHLAVPMDRQALEIEYDYKATGQNPVSQKLIDIHGLDEVSSVIRASSNVAVLVGSGVRKSGASAQLLAFAEQYQLPVATTMGAKGDFPEDHPLSLGVFGWAGSEQANETLMSDEVDCLLVVGSRLGQIATMCWDKRFAANRKLIQLDINSHNLNRNFAADLAVVTDAGAALEYLSYKKIQQGHDELHQKTSLQRTQWLDEITRERAREYVPAREFVSSDPVHPAFAIAELMTVAPRYAQLFVDNGAHTFFATHYWQSIKENRFFSAIKYSGAMGWAIPACIGARFSQPDAPAIAIVGDGCMLMHGIEIQTASRYGLENIVFVVLNNQAHGNPKLRLKDISDQEHEVTNIPDHDWAMFARSLGLEGYTIEKSEDLAPVLSKCFAQSAPVLIDIKCGLYETPTKVFDESFMKEFNSYIAE